MTELKPCPFCGAGKDCPPEVGDDDFVSCRYCGARASFDRWDDRPAPELPDGYRADEDGNLWFRSLCIASFTEKGSLLVIGGQEPQHWPACAIWLQRRSNENA